MFKLNLDELKSGLQRVLIKYGFNEEKADIIAKIFAENDLCGKYSHGLNRFPSFIAGINSGTVIPDSNPELVNSLNAVECWDGNLGAGPYNAKFCTEKAIELSKKFGIGCAILKNTNHWMRGGTYGEIAAKSGYIFIGWTNATPLMPAWGSSEAKLGNNPLVIAVPNKPEPVVLDMALSQYSYGKLEIAKRSGEKLKYNGGFDKNGELSKEPADILESHRALPVGLWKGAGMSLLFDLIVSVMSEGKTVSQIGKQNSEYGVSQIFIILKPGAKSGNNNYMGIIERILNDYLSSKTIDKSEIFYPGQQSYRIKNYNLKVGIPVDEKLWEQIQNF